jgi:hypothetical protein
MLNPAGLRVNLREFFLGCRHWNPQVVENNGTGTRCSLIEGKDVSFHI